VTMMKTKISLETYFSLTLHTSRQDSFCLTKIVDANYKSIRYLVETIVCNNASYKKKIKSIIYSVQKQSNNYKICIGQN